MEKTNVYRAQGKMILFYFDLVGKENLLLTFLLSIRYDTTFQVLKEKRAQDLLFPLPYSKYYRMTFILPLVMQNILLEKKYI